MQLPAGFLAQRSIGGNRPEIRVIGQVCRDMLKALSECFQAPLFVVAKAIDDGIRVRIALGTILFHKGSNFDAGKSQIEDLPQCTLEAQIREAAACRRKLGYLNFRRSTGESRTQTPDWHLKQERAPFHLILLV